jgi:hypothetical protein
MAKPIRIDTGDDPFTSPGRQAERDAFATKQRTIWIGAVLAAVLAVVGAVLLFR